MKVDITSILIKSIIQPIKDRVKKIKIATRETHGRFHDILQL